MLLRVFVCLSTMRSHSFAQQITSSRNAVLPNFLESQVRLFTNGVIGLVALSRKDVQLKQPIEREENWFSIPTFMKSVVKLQKN